VAIRAATDSLKQVGALSAKLTLTSLGHHLAYVPIDLRLAKVLLYGAIFRCVDPAATIAACLGAGRSPLVSPPDKRAESALAHEKFVVPHSDHLTLLRVYDGWASIHSTSEKRRFCQQNYLSEHSLQDISKLRKQLLSSLQEMGFLRPETQSKCNQHSKYTKLLSAVVCAGLYPRVVKVKKAKTVYQETMAGAFEKQGQSGEIKYYLEDDRVFMHPSSVRTRTGPPCCML
jgi:ATP-dependent RNA helicase DHX57